MNRRRNGGFLPPVKQYVNAIERRLHLPLREKARIMSDISTSIAARHEAGESYEAVMADMGPPMPWPHPSTGPLQGSIKAVPGAFYGWGWPWLFWLPLRQHWYSPPAWLQVWKWPSFPKAFPGRAPPPQA